MIVVPNILRRRRWMPGAHAEIDFSHPLARGLVGCWLLTGESLVENRVSGKIATAVYSTAQKRTSGPYGRSVYTGADAYYQITDEDNLVLSGPLSVTFSGKLWDTVGPIIGFYDTDSPYYGWSLETVGTSYRFWDSTAWRTFGTSKMADEAWHICTIANNAGLTSWIDGAVDGTSVAGNPTAYVGTKCLLSTSGGGAVAQYSHFSFVYIHNRALDLNDAQWLYQEPYAFLRDPVSSRFISVGTAPVGGSSVPVLANHYARMRAG